MTDRERWYLLGSTVILGPAAFEQMLFMAGTVEEIFKKPPEYWFSENILNKAQVQSLKKAYAEEAVRLNRFAALEKEQIRFVLLGEEEYPERLLQLPHPPRALFVKGRLPDPAQPALAIVGTRACSEYGSFVAKEMGALCGKAKIPVISGMALGIDSIAQRAALSEGGYSLGVLGCGVDICYPGENRGLYERLASEGGLISEAPPGTRGFSWLFPVRNRIIACLAKAVLVVEGQEKSGTQITVTHALNLGREVFAVPGRMTDPMSRGTNRIISEGGRILLDFEEVLSFFGKKRRRKEKLESRLAALSPEERLIYEKMGTELRHLEDLMGLTGLPVGTLAAGLARLCEQKMVSETGKNYFLRT